MKQYVVHYGDEDKLIEVPDEAVLELGSIAAGENNSQITVLRVREKDQDIAAFVGVMRYFPVELEARTRTWARG